MKKCLIPGSREGRGNRAAALLLLNGAVGASPCGQLGKAGDNFEFNVISQSIVRENISADMHILYKCHVVKDIQQLTKFSA